MKINEFMEKKNLIEKYPSVLKWVINKQYFKRMAMVGVFENYWDEILKQIEVIKTKNKTEVGGKIPHTRFRKGCTSKDAKNAIFHDLECLELKDTRDNKYHYNLLRGNLEDIFGVIGGLD